jgi:Sortase domain
VPAERARRRPPTGLIAAIAVPALVAGLAVALLGHSRDEPAKLAHPGDPKALARAAAGAATQDDSPDGKLRLRPISPRAGVSGLESQPLERLAGGIRPAPPVAISIPTAGVRALVEGVKAHHGALRVPSIGRAGWYEGGPRPGEPGRAVIIGHLDTGRGPGLFARVPSIRPGTEIAVTDARGGVHRYTAVGGAEVRKDRFPARYVYGRSRSPVLVLITCGGPFRPGRGYRDNVLLYARAA